MDLATQTHLATVRQALLQRQGELRAAVHAAEMPRRVVPADAAAEVTDLKALSAEQQQGDIDQAQEQRYVAELARVDAALRRLHDGRYGDCADCGEPIAWARLLVQPAAERCAPCQAAAEHHAPRPA